MNENEMRKALEDIILTWGMNYTHTYKQRYIKCLKIARKGLGSPQLKSSSYQELVKWVKENNKDVPFNGTT